MTAASSGAIAGAVVVLGQPVIIDLPTPVVALASLVIYWRLVIPEPLLVLAVRGVGLVLRRLGIGNSPRRPIAREQRTRQECCRGVAKPAAIRYCLVCLRYRWTL